MKIKVIVPILSNDAALKSMEEMYQKLVRPETKVEVVGLKKGPETIEYYYDEEFAKIPLLEEVQKAEKEGFDAVLISCTSDPGLSACREIVDIPVVGLGQAEFLVCMVLGSRICTITPGSPVMTRDLVRSYGIEHFVVSVRSVPLSVSELEDKEKAKKAALELARRSIEEDGADVIMLDCAGFRGLMHDLQKELGVPVVGAEVGILVVEALVLGGLSHSKIAFPHPTQKKRIK